MTISSEVRTAGPFTGTGAVSTFNFAFKVFQASDLLVVRQLISTGAQTTLTLTTDYTVSLNVDQDSSPGGSITLVAGALATIYKLVITSDVGNLQPTILTNQGGFYPEVINDSLDRATIQIQQVAVKSGRELSAPLIDGTIDMTLPSAANRASKFLYFGASGEPMAAAGTNTGNNTSPGNLTLTANNGNSGTARDVIFYDNTTETMRILGSGATSKVGIGTATPATKLHVKGVNNILRLETTDAIASGGVCYLDLYGSAGRGGYLGFGGSSNILDIWNDTAGVTRFGTNNAEQMRIDSSGNIIIGATSSALNARLSVFESNSNLSGIRTTNTDNSAYGVIAVGGTNCVSQLSWTNSVVFEGVPSGSGNTIIGSYTNALTFCTSTGRTERMRITSAGEVLIAGITDQGAYNLQCNGTGVWGAGAYVNGSDSRIKHDINPIGSCLDLVAAIEPVTFVYNADWSSDQTLQTGFIAQQLQTALAGQPYLDGIVSQGGEYLNVAYQNIIPLLTKSIQELKAIVEAQAARIAALEARA